MVSSCISSCPCSREYLRMARSPHLTLSRALLSSPLVSQTEPLWSFPVAVAQQNPVQGQAVQTVLGARHPPSMVAQVPMPAFQVQPHGLTVQGAEPQLPLQKVPPHLEHVQTLFREE